MLSDPDVLETFQSSRPLPSGYGVGLDERVVEFLWVAAQNPRGKVLDAGSSLNHTHVLDYFQPRLAELTITTLEPEETSYVDRQVSYVFTDFRELPFRDKWFDCVISISSVEHVGMDNRSYGSSVPRAADPAAEMERAVSEFRRVLRPAGRILISVPYGRPEDHGWFRQFGYEDVARLLEALGGSASASFYRYRADGWQLSDAAGAGDTAYRDYMADPTPVDDLAAAARGVCCISATP